MTQRDEQGHRDGRQPPFAPLLRPVPVPLFLTQNARLSKLVPERWDTMSEIPARAEWKNGDGKF